MNLPNKLTVARMVMAVFFVMALLLPAEGVIRTHYPLGKTTALVVFIIACLTDWLDGHIARRQKLETHFGSLMDPLADKILVAAAFICFIEINDAKGNPLVQAWMTLVIVAREFLVTGLRLVAREQGVVLRAERLGKHKTFSQMLTIIVVLAGLAMREDWNFVGMSAEEFDVRFSNVVFWMMLGTVTLTVFSGAIYFWRNRGLFLRDA
jgi:CDP-diacylglycerol--glycerol-3-phosphate 3-phosphatidyltransferase